MPEPGSFYFGAPVDAVRLARIDAQRRAATPGETIACDLVVMAGGYTPAAALACHAGAKLVYDPALNALQLNDLTGRGLHRRQRQSHPRSGRR